MTPIEALQLKPGDLVLMRERWGEGIRRHRSGRVVTVTRRAGYEVVITLRWPGRHKGTFREATARCEYCEKVCNMKFDGTSDYMPRSGLNLWVK
jgi:hypothetical protein